MYFVILYRKHNITLCKTGEKNAPGKLSRPLASIALLKFRLLILEKEFI